MLNNQRVATSAKECSELSDKIPRFSHSRETFCISNPSCCGQSTEEARTHTNIYIYIFTYIHIYIYIHIFILYIYIIRRPWPSPRQGRRLGPPEVWNLLCHSPLLLRHSSLPLPGFKRLKLLKPSKSFAAPATKPLQTFKTLTTLQLLHCFLAPAATKPSGRQPLLLQGCSLPFACTSLAAASTKLLAASVPALSLPFACT